MRRLSHSQLQNLIFIGVVMLVAAAAVVYMLLREDPTQASASHGTPAFTPNPSPEPKETRRGFEGAPPSVLLAQLEADGCFTISKSAEHEYSLRLIEDGEDAAIAMRLTESGGRITSLLWTFPLPEKPAGEPKNEIEKRLKENYETDLAAMRTRVETVLMACIRGSDLNGRLLEPTLYLWCDGALKTLKDGKSYRNVEENCAFTAQRVDNEGPDTLLCALLFP